MDKLKANLESQQLVSMIKDPNKKRTVERPEPTDARPAAPAAAPAGVKAAGPRRTGKPHAVQTFNVTHGGVDEVDDDAIHTCGLKDPDHPERTCLHTCLGSVALRRHHEGCAFQRAQCPNAKCGAAVARGALPAHLEICKHQCLECFRCLARYYRLDADYHHAVCPKLDIKCPLSCGLVLPRGELDHHLRNDYMLHSHQVMECQDYLADDHPSRVYGVLLRRLKELRAQVELGRLPGLTRSYDHELSPVYTPTKINTYTERYPTGGGGGGGKAFDFGEEAVPAWSPPTPPEAEEMELEEVDDY